MNELSLLGRAGCSGGKHHMLLMGVDIALELSQIDRNVNGCHAETCGAIYGISIGV